ncbi:MAG TPA: DUF1573 domain-containing protein [Bacteroidetes bacterium]|jgi:hypothetical protein|nr:MAG: hypothetical protein ABR94_01870 [Sphingobacteriales bacterium BACL12 MAG-120802-bin5]KRP10929.1 MAG: hypothetical protein ABR95_11900 [Sphingobacteriales bacterium BACL12 MAG-120813-bin55]HCK22235.1 DUF1573 domain-containing protein [Bacteroidota bacterium]
MKRISITVILLTILVALSSCKEKSENGGISTDLIQNPSTADGEVDMENMPVMTFDKDMYDFGEIIQGEKVTYNFAFTNTGKSNLIISSARASCGCTVPSWPKEPIAPGESSNITVQYNSEGRSNAFNKVVTITANTIPNENRITIKGVVIVPQQ